MIKKYVEKWLQLVILWYSNYFLRDKVINSFILDENERGQKQWR